MRLLQTITEDIADQDAESQEETATPAEPAASGEKQKYIVKINKDGKEVEKKAKAFSIDDIKHHFGDAFVSAELMDAAEDAAAKKTEGPETVEESLKNRKDQAFQLYMTGAISRKEYDKRRTEVISKQKAIKDAKAKKAAEPVCEMRSTAPPFEKLLKNNIHDDYFVVKAYMHDDMIEPSDPITVYAQGERNQCLKFMKKYKGKGMTLLDPKGKLCSYVLEDYVLAVKRGPHIEGYYDGYGVSPNKEKASKFKGVARAKTEADRLTKAKRDLLEPGFRFVPINEEQEILAEMAKRVTPAAFWDMMKREYGETAAQNVSWVQIKSVADKNDVLIPAYIRDNKTSRGRWTAKPASLGLPKHEPKVALKSTAPEVKAPVKAAPEPFRYKEHYTKSDFPGVEFYYTAGYDISGLFDMIEREFKVARHDIKRIDVDHDIYFVRDGTLEVLGRKVGGQPYGNLAVSAAKKQARANADKYGFWVKPQYGQGYVSVGTPNSAGPWDSREIAQMHVGDKYDHFEYDDEFNHGGTIKVVKVKKENGEWVLA